MAGNFEYQNKYGFNVCKQETSLIIGGNSQKGLVEGNREPHEAKKKSFDLGGNRTHDLRIRSTVTLPSSLCDLVAQSAE